jgi:hypothetical protein
LSSRFFEHLSSEARLARTAEAAELNGPAVKLADVRTVPGAGLSRSHSRGSRSGWSQGSASRRRDPAQMSVPKGEAEGDRAFV